jgi:hypothetical protein
MPLSRRIRYKLRSQSSPPPFSSLNETQQHGKESESAYEAKGDRNREQRRLHSLSLRSRELSKVLAP